ncbi:MAG: caspase family protein [Nitrosomonas sp.]|nr:caspase family protein [Nitrosomonas sp.]
MLIDVMAGCSNSTNLIILDACRNNPYVRAWNRDASVNGLAPVFTPKGTLIAFSTSPGETAADGAGRNGSYTESLLRHINIPDVPIEDVFKRTRNTLSVITSGRQTSWEHTSLTGDFVFNISTGRQISIYSASALADERYLLSNANPLRNVITGLMSHDWYRQNPSVDALNVELLGSADNDALFVLGRNIYQAAVCGSRNAVAYLWGFKNHVQGLASDKVKALLDGVLFEIFFNSKGELRKDFKISYFNTVFEMKKFVEFAPSFDFISEVLINYQNRFYVVPGKPRNVTVDISTTLNANGESVITGIYFEGFNILRQSDDPMAMYFKDKPSFYPTNLDRLRDQISMEMIIPLSQLTLNPTMPLSSNGMLLPSYHTVSK